MMKKSKFSEEQIAAPCAKWTREPRCQKSHGRSGSAKPRTMWANTLRSDGRGRDPVVAALERVAKRSGYPKMITVDNGSDFASKALDAWAYGHGVKLGFIRPGTPVENAVMERFTGRFRDECLNANVFVSLHDARLRIEA